MREWHGANAKREGEREREKKKNEWIIAKANTVETRRGLNICFAKGRQSTTGKKRNVHIQDGFYYIRIYTSTRERNRDSWHIFFTTTNTILSLVSWRERKNKLCFHSLVREGNHSINHPDSFSTIKPKKYDIELDLRYRNCVVRKSNRRKKNRNRMLFLPVLCICSSIRSWFFLCLLFTLENKCLYKPQLVLPSYLHMNRVRPIENRWTTRGEREEAGGGLRINHNRLQASTSFFFSYFFLLFSTTKQIICVDTIATFFFPLALFAVHVCLIGSERIVSHKQRNLINPYWTTSKFPSFSSISSFLIGVKYLIYTISFGYTKNRERERKRKRKNIDFLLT